MDQRTKWGNCSSRRNLSFNWRLILAPEYWRRVCNARKLPRISFHALRHCHASLLLAAGVPVLTVSRRLGHAKASQTLDIYAHLLPGADADAARAIEGMLK
jgi:integrase